MESTLENSQVIPKRSPGRPKTLPLFHGVPPEEGMEKVLPYQQNQAVIDQAMVGTPDDVRAAVEIAEASDKQIASLFAGSIHPITKTQRIIVWLLKLEELGLSGNLKAFEILLDRAFGKVTETIAVAHGEFEGMKDGELLKALEGVKALRKKDN